MKIKILLFFMYFLSIHTLYAFNPCNENISLQDKQTYEVANLNPPLFQCSFAKNTAVWQYNAVLQKDYEATLKELQDNFPTLSLEEAKGLRYALYMQNALNILERNEDKKTSNIIGKALGSVHFTQKDRENFQQTIDFYYKKATKKLNPTQIHKLSIKLYGESKSLAILQKAKVTNTFSKKDIMQAIEDNKKILQEIQESIDLHFTTESEEIFHVDIVNNLAFIYNANLLINEGKDFKERRYKAYEGRASLELLELLSLFIDTIQNEENQFIAMQGSLITIQEALMSIDTHTPFTKEDYERVNGKREYIEHYGNLLKLDGVKTMLDRIKVLRMELSQLDTQYAIRAVIRSYFTKFDSISRVSQLASKDSDFVKRIFEMLDYQDAHLNREKYGK